MDTSSASVTITVDFETSAQDIDQINFNTFDQAPKRNKFMLFFSNIGKKMSPRPINKDKKFDDVDMESIRKVNIHETLFGKLKSTIRRQKPIYSAPVEDEEDDSHGLIL